MWKFFGYGEKTEEKPLQVIESPPAIETTLKKLDTQLKEADFQIAKYTRLAKCFLQNGQTNQASRANRNRKIWLKKQQIISGQISNLDSTKMTMESTASAHQMVASLKEAQTVMATQIETFDVEELEELRDDLNAMQTRASDMNNILATPFDSEADLDELDDTETLFAQWDQERILEEENHAVALLPAIPTRPLKLKDDNNNNNNNDRELEPNDLKK